MIYTRIVDCPSSSLLGSSELMSAVKLCVSSYCLTANTALTRNATPACACIHLDPEVWRCRSRFPLPFPAGAASRLEPCARFLCCRGSDPTLPGMYLEYQRASQHASPLLHPASIVYSYGKSPSLGLGCKRITLPPLPSELSLELGNRVLGLLRGLSRTMTEPVSDPESAFERCEGVRGVP